MFDSVLNVVTPGIRRPYAAYGRRHNVDAERVGWKTLQPGGRDARASGPATDA